MKKRRYKRSYLSGEDIDMLNERSYYKKTSRKHKNICDTHEDGA